MRSSTTALVFAGTRRSVRLGAQATEQARHLDGSERRLGSLVSLVTPCPGERLVHVVTGQHTASDRNTRVSHHLAYAVGHAAAHVFEVRRAAANHRSESNHRVVTVADRQRAHCLRNLERTRYL